MNSPDSFSRELENALKKRLSHPGEVSEEAMRILLEGSSEAMEKQLNSVSRPARTDPVLYATEIGKKCVRQVIYSVETPEIAEPLPYNARLKFMYGDVVEALILGIVRDAGYTVEGQQEVVESGVIGGTEWTIRGRMDAIIEGHVVDVKSASTYAFQKFKEGLSASKDNFGYIPQLQFYHGFSRATSDEALFLAFDKQNGSVVCDEHRWRKEESVAYVTGRAFGVSDAMAHGLDTVPRVEPVPEGKSGNMKLDIACSYCPFKQECWKDANDGKGLRTFLYGRGPVDLVSVKREPKVPELNV